MNHRGAVRLAWALWGLDLALLVVGMVLGVSGELPTSQLAVMWLLPAFELTSATVGALISSRHPRNAIGWLFLAASFMWGVASVSVGLATFAAAGHVAVTGWVLFADWLGSWIFIPGIYIPVIFLFLLFPTGRLLSTRWRWVAVVASVAVTLVTLELAFSPGPQEDAIILKNNPYGIGEERAWLWVAYLSWIPAILGIVVSAAAVVIRFRRSRGEEREQMKWLAYAGVAVAVLFVAAGIGWGTVTSDFAASVVLPAMILFALLLVPVATGIAILRHRLFDIDVVINRTIVYGALAVFVTVVYLGIVAGIGALLGSRRNLVLSVVATALIALVFQPARERARRLANRLVYGRRATPYEVMSEFAERMAGTYSLDDVLPRMASIAAEGTGADRVEIWVRVGEDFRREASWPQESAAAAVSALSSVEADHVVPVTHRDDVLGAIAVDMPRSEALRPAGGKLLADLASQAGLVLRNVRLIEELRASRQRLVAAQDQERRRLERNIHDGAQQQLVALAIKLRLAENLVRKDADKAAELVAQVRSESQQALEDLRDLARGIYPPLLADQGLAAALHSQARKAALSVTVKPDGVGRYPQEAEAAAYFCVLEALQNVSKYAGASAAVVRLSEENGDLVFTVSDDGRGFDTAATPRGSGLQNMADRLDALGGRFEIVSRPSEGTTVIGRIPIQPVASAQAASSRSGSNSDLGM